MADQQPPENKPTESTPRRRSAVPAYLWWVAAAALLLALTLYFAMDAVKVISLTEFDKLTEQGQVKRMAFEGKTRIRGEVRNQQAEEVKPLNLTGGKFAVNLPPLNDTTPIKTKVENDDKAALARRKAADPTDATPPVQISADDEPPQFVAPLMLTALLFAGFIAFFLLVLLPRLREANGGGFAAAFTRSPARKYDKGNRGRITFDDVAGMEGVKRELQEIVDFLRNPDKFTRLGAQVPKGVLLIGPPGTGKTLLGRAVAGEANVPFYSVNGSEFIQMFVGVGAGRVRDLFRTAKENAPCVVFIDEIDAVGRMRGTGVGGGSDEREQTLNQILGEMDGFHPSETVIVLAATNRPDVLDAALTRPGRFDRQVTVDRPTWQGRLAVLKVHTRTKPLDEAVNLERVARATIGMSGADLKNICNEAALHATREGKNRIGQDDFDAALDRVRLGAKREELFSDEEKRRTAYHEAGHALCAYLEPKADPIDRVSIIPRGRTGGVTLFSPDEDRIDRSLSEFMAQLVVILGGRAADQLVFGEPLSGAIGDIRQATRLARALVTQFGMSDRLGPVHYRQSDDHVFLGKEIGESREFSEGTARIIDEEVQRIVTEAMTRATELMARSRDDLDKLAGALIVQEELDRDEVHRLLRKGHPDGSPVTEPPPEPTGGALSPAFGT